MSFLRKLKDRQNSKFFNRKNFFFVNIFIEKYEKNAMRNTYCGFF